MTSLQRLLTTALVAALLLLPAAAHASSSMETGIADDAALLNEPSDARAAAAVAAWAALGIDDVRIFVQWQAIAPGLADVKAPDGFDSADPNSPGYDWSRVDRAVSLVSAAGMRPLLVVTGPGPLWASQVPARHSIRYKPRPDLFGQFARAAALRYAGAVTDGSSGTSPTCPSGCSPRTRARASAAPRTRRICTGAWCRPPIRRSRPSTPPRPCSSARWRPTVRTRPSRTPGRDRWPSSVRWAASRSRSSATAAGPCKGFKPLTADGLAYHPHATTLAPNQAQAILDNASIGDLPRLERTLDATQRAGGLKKAGGGKFGLYFTEWGYQTRPPDNDAGRLAGQAVALPAAGRLHRLQGPAGQAPDPVRVARRAHPPLGQRPLLRVAVGPALRQRQGQALAGDLREPVLRRPASGQPQRPTLGPGAPGQRAPVTVERRRPAASAGRR